MKGAATKTATRSGFVVLLLYLTGDKKKVEEMLFAINWWLHILDLIPVPLDPSVPGSSSPKNPTLTMVKGQDGWGVTYPSTQICTVKGSTVVIHCTYTFPPSWNEQNTKVMRALWFTKVNRNQPVDLITDPLYTDRVEYHFHKNNCTLRITDMRESDVAEYKFMFITNQPEGRVTGSPGVTLSVTEPDLHVEVIKSTELNCHSSCHLPERPSYIWYKNGRMSPFLKKKAFPLSALNPADSFTCALGGHEGFPSNPVCVEGENCNKVTYTDRNICASEGSSVDISCTYNSYRAITSKFWFTPERSHQWKFPSSPEDLSEDYMYAGRVQVIETERGRSTLRISDLRWSDSAWYHFKFKTRSDEWHNDLAATSLIVTALQVQVNIIRVYWTNTFAELECLSSCSPAVHPSYIWFKNGENIQIETSSLTRYFYTEDSFACALKGYENFPSTSVCVHDQICNRVMYDVKSICSLEGSSVDISSTYFSYENYERKIWFSPDRSHQWQDHTQPEDISKDSQYADRVRVIERQRGRSTLRISDLRERDSGQYHFKFKTSSFEWKSSLPGTTLTVTALQVRVTMATFQQDHTEAELRCHNSCSPAGRISYVWFKNGEKILNEENSSYKDLFYPGNDISCAVRGLESYRSPSLYALNAPSVSTSPSREIMEGTSVTLNCNSDADGAVKFSWYKRNRTLSSKEAELIFGSVLSSDSGEYCCTAENELGKRTSEGIFINVKYGPRLPTVSVSPSAEIMEGSSVTLACSSDANPAANYTWYRENEESPEASGPTFTITYIRAEQSGNYYCEANNGIGRHNSILIVIDVTGAWTSTVAVTTMVVVLAIILLSVFILIKKKRASKQQCGERPDDNREQCLPTQGQQEEQDDLHYSSVKFTKNQADSLYSNIRPAQRHRHNEEERDEGVEYSAITFNKGPSAPN